MDGTSKVPSTIPGTGWVLNNCANNSTSVLQMGKDFEWWPLTKWGGNSNVSQFYTKSYGQLRGDSTRGKWGPVIWIHKTWKKNTDNHIKCENLFLEILSSSVPFKVCVGAGGWHSNEQAPPSVLSQPIGCWAPGLKATCPFNSEN